MQAIYRYRFHILAGLFVINLLGFWPGYLVSDSATQYQQAVSGQYTDHHPPLMSFVWHYLNMLYPGHALMYVLQIGLLYSSIAVFLLTLDKMRVPNKTWLSIILLALPIYPQVLVYSVSVVKDNQFTFSFMLATSILSYYSIINKKPPVSVIYLLILILFYGSAVKFQGQYCLIVPALWLGCLLNIGAKLWRKLVTGILLYGLIFFAVGNVNNVLVPDQRKNYSWQFVKLYDLAAISLSLKTDLIPQFNKTTNYTEEKFHQRFQYPAIDPYIFGADPILTVTKSPEQMSQLYHVWLKAVLYHPYIYLKHRAINISHVLLSRPGYQHAVPLLNKIPRQSSWYNTISYIVGSLFYVFMSHLLVIILGVVYFLMSIFCWRKSTVAPVLFAMSSLALMMVGLLFFMSMAGVPRYTYMAIVIIHSAHIFAYACYKQALD